ncbi:MAG: L-seryl-tRNA(Sec) selenium transferase [Planctomycetes bacterium]|nr:L-seryl-tRNA(Sec) selenium transferase [Planctomycetota bacterium]
MDTTDRSDVADLLRGLPAVDAIARDARLSDLPQRAVVREARRLLDAVRDAVRDGSLGRSDATRDALVARLREAVHASLAQRHRRVINATGIAAGYAVVEVDPRSGQRNQREEAVAALLTELTGAPAAIVVNNNAAAVVLVLRALAEGREVVVSRGELVEIGGGFRMPDVMAQSGCRMVEVGTTNRTHLRDYERAIGPATAMLLKVHTSNFRVLGFCASPALGELATLGRARGVCVFDDLGSGLLAPEVPEGLGDEPRVRDSLAAGVNVVSFSGDKLLGGPQCGIVLGDAALVARIRAHPLYRAVRCDKLTLAALEATLLIYRDGDPLAEVPALRAIARSPDALCDVATRLSVALSIDGASVRVSESFAGSGANPARALPSFAVVLPGGARVAERLRQFARPAVFCRVADDAVWLDARTLADEDLDEVARVIRSALSC